MSWAGTNKMHMRRDRTEAKYRFGSGSILPRIQKHEAFADTAPHFGRKEQVLPKDDPVFMGDIGLRAGLDSRFLG